MSKAKPKVCKEVKHPCKICLGPVTQKNGLQCCGACESWVHYVCSNYTPGRIKDIKDGVIRVTCPCPDCETTLPKEYRTDNSTGCANESCPANHPPKCDNRNCPIYDHEPPPDSQDTMSQMPSAQWPGLQCGPVCKKFPPKPEELVHPQSPPLTGGAPACGLPQCKVHTNQQGQHMPMMPYQTSSHFNRLQEQQAQQSAGAPACNLPQCKVHTQQQGQYMPMPYQTSSHFNRQQEPQVGDNCPSGEMTSLSFVEQMCGTVGQLTKQLNELMCKMRDVTKTNGGGGSNGPGPAPHPTRTHHKGQGPKSCYCPGNPRR